LESYVENAHKTWLRQQGQAEQLADLDVTAALEMLAQQAQWGKCRDTARQHGPQAISCYLVLHATQLIKVCNRIKFKNGKEFIKHYMILGNSIYSQDLG
jgi:hypothetical protein